MNWFLIALLPPILWSITNHIDKYLLSKYFKDGAIGSVTIFSSAIALLILPILIIIHPEVLKQFDSNYLLISLNGTLYLLASIPYFYALEKDDASLTVPLFQMIPIFSFLLEYVFLDETFSITQIIGGSIILISSIFISLNLSDFKKMKMKWDIFGLMVLSSFLFALNFLFFKYFTLETNFWITSFWEYIGFVIFGIFLFIFIKSYRQSFITTLKKNKLRVLGINSINEIINIIAKIAFNVASVITPVTLVWFINGLQPFFVFIFGILLTIFFPKISKEDISKKTLLQRIIAIMVIILGTYLVNQG